MTRNTRLLPSDAYPNQLADTPEALDHIDNQLRSMQFMIPERPGLYTDAQGDIWIHIGSERWIDHNGESYPAEYTPVLAMFAPFTDILETRDVIFEQAPAINKARTLLCKVQRRVTDAMLEHEEHVSSLSDTLPNTITDDEISYILEDMHTDVTYLITRIDNALASVGANIESDNK